MSSLPRRLPKPVGLLAVTIVLLALVAGVVLGGQRLYRSVLGNKDYTGTGTGTVVVRVRQGDTARDIGVTLVADGVVRSTGAFTEAASGEARSRSVQPGFFQLRRQMSAASALQLLLDPAARLRSRVTIPEGTALAKVVDRIVAGTQVTRPDLLAALSRSSTLGLPAYAGGRPEGFLFPATYDVEPGTGAAAVLTLLTQRFGEEAASLDLEGGARALGVTPYDIVKVASLIEAETALDSDRAKVAGVIYNRLRKGMRLQLDSTVNYLRIEKVARLSLVDIQVDSPYNTYRHTGLPPTPISSPGGKALTAALHPASGDALFFITIDKAGHSLFTASYDEFLRAKAKAQRDGVY